MSNKKEYRKQWHDNHRAELIVYSAEWRKEHPDYMKEFDEKRRHPCLDCGRLISRLGKRCKSCAGKQRWQTNPLIKTKAKRRISDGYVFIHQSSHRNANSDGYVREHLLVWEQAHNKPLPKCWIVHHLNGIKDDNRPCNLKALPERKHKFVLAAKAKRIQELEAMLNNQHQLL